MAITATKVEAPQQNLTTAINRHNVAKAAAPASAGSIKESNNSKGVGSQTDSNLPQLHVDPSQYAIQEQAPVQQQRTPSYAPLFVMPSFDSVDQTLVIPTAQAIRNVGVYENNMETIEPRGEDNAPAGSSSNLFG